jgi:hypothetical protein
MIFRRSGFRIGGGRASAPVARRASGPARGNNEAHSSQPIDGLSATDFLIRGARELSSGFPLWRLWTFASRFVVGLHKINVIDAESVS